MLTGKTTTTTTTSERVYPKKSSQHLTRETASRPPVCSLRSPLSHRDHARHRRAPAEKPSQLLIKKLIFKIEIGSKMHGNNANVIFTPLIGQEAANTGLGGAHSYCLWTFSKTWRALRSLAPRSMQSSPARAAGTRWVSQGQSLKRSK